MTHFVPEVVGTGHAYNIGPKEQRIAVIKHVAGITLRVQSVFGSTGAIQARIGDTTLTIQTEQAAFSRLDNRREATTQLRKLPPDAVVACSHFAVRAAFADKLRHRQQLAWPQGFTITSRLEGNSVIVDDAYAEGLFIPRLTPRLQLPFLRNKQLPGLDPGTVWNLKNSAPYPFYFRDEQGTNHRIPPTQTPLSLAIQNTELTHSEEGVPIVTGCVPGLDKAAVATLMEEPPDTIFLVDTLTLAAVRRHAPEELASRLFAGSHTVPGLPVVQQLMQYSPGTDRRIGF